MPLPIFKVYRGIRVPWDDGFGDVGRDRVVIETTLCHNAFPLTCKSAPNPDAQS